MAVRSRRVFGPTQLTSSLAILYTVPTDRTLVVRSLWLYNSNAGDVSVLLTVNGSGVSNRLANLLVPAQRQLLVSEELILDPGDVLRGSGSVTAVANIAAFGSLLEGAPE